VAIDECRNRRPTAHRGRRRRIRAAHTVPVAVSVLFRDLLAATTRRARAWQSVRSSARRTAVEGFDDQRTSHSERVRASGSSSILRIVVTRPESKRSRTGECSDAHRGAGDGPVVRVAFADSTRPFASFPRSTVVIGRCSSKKRPMDIAVIYGVIKVPRTYLLSARDCGGQVIGGVTEDDSNS